MEVSVILSTSQAMISFIRYTTWYQISQKFRKFWPILSRRFALLAPKDILICFWLSNLLTLIIEMACHICGKHLYDHIISLMCIDFSPFYDFDVWFWYCSYRMAFLFFHFIVPDVLQTHIVNTQIKYL